MAVRERVQKSAPQEQKQSKPSGSVHAPNREAEAELKERMDELIDEIDDVLEEDAASFVKSYVQKGGQAIGVTLGSLADWILGGQGRRRDWRRPSAVLMWATLAGAWEALADAAGFTIPTLPTSGDRTTAYLCRACNVHGRGPDDKSLTCWSCGNSDDLKRGLVPGVNGHYRSFGPRTDQCEDVESLVG